MVGHIRLVTLRAHAHLKKRKQRKAEHDRNYAESDRRSWKSWWMRLLGKKDDDDA